MITKIQRMRFQDILLMIRVREDFQLKRPEEASLDCIEGTIFLYRDKQGCEPEVPLSRKHRSEVKPATAYRKITYNVVHECLRFGTIASLQQMQGLSMVVMLCCHVAGLPVFI